MRIQRQTEASVRHFAEHPEQIPNRLGELDREWDIERAIEANAALLAFMGTLLGARQRRSWLMLPAIVTAFLFQHSMQGWCPPVPIFRRLGFRTSHEIEAERNALKAIRGDYDAVRQAEDRVRAALQAVGRFKVSPEGTGAGAPHDEPVPEHQPVA